VYFVNSIQGDADGCSYPGTNWVIIEGRIPPDGTVTPAVVAQEIGHLALLTHSDDTENVMCSGTGTGGVACNPGRTGITDFQCCTVRYSPLTSYEPCNKRLISFQKEILRARISKKKMRQKGAKEHTDVSQKQP
jgi:hypothetical protein